MMMIDKFKYYYSSSSSMRVAKTIVFDNDILSFFSFREKNLSDFIRRLLLEEKARIEDKIPKKPKEVKKRIEEIDKEKEELMPILEEATKTEEEKLKQTIAEIRIQTRRDELIKLIAEKTEERNATMNKDDEEARAKGYILLKEIRALQKELNELSS
jgi:predicted acylesterase/phospholipase RssA